VIDDDSVLSAESSVEMFEYGLSEDLVDLTRCAKRVTPHASAEMPAYSANAAPSERYLSKVCSWRPRRYIKKILTVAFVQHGVEWTV